MKKLYIIGYEKSWVHTWANSKEEAKKVIGNLEMDYIIEIKEAVHREEVLKALSFKLK